MSFKKWILGLFSSKAKETADEIKLEIKKTARDQFFGALSLDENEVLQYRPELEIFYKVLKGEPVNEDETRHIVTTISKKLLKHHKDNSLETSLIATIDLLKQNIKPSSLSMIKSIVMLLDDEYVEDSEIKDLLLELSSLVLKRPRKKLIVTPVKILIKSLRETNEDNSQ